MRSLRLDPDLDQRVQRAAAREGVSVSEFLRRAAEERADRALRDAKPSEALAFFIAGAPPDAPAIADKKAAYHEHLVEKHLRRRKSDAR